MFTKRSLIALASLAAAMVAHAGTIQINSIATLTQAETDSSLDKNGTLVSTGYIDAYSSYFPGNGSAVATAENSIDFDGTTLSGYGQVENTASAGKSGAAFSSSVSGQFIAFTLTAKSNVSLGLTADLGTSVIQKKGGSAAAVGFSSSSLAKFNGATYDSLFEASSLNATPDVYNGTTVLDQGQYAIFVLSTVNNTVNGGSTTGALASSYAYGYGAYSLTATAVPEPTSMAVLACGAVALLRRRKKA